MVSTPNSANIFGSFLSSAEQAENPADIPAGAAVERNLLAALAASDQPRTIRSLMESSGAPPSELMAAMHSLEQARLISTETVDADMMIRLTDLGRKLG